MSRRDNGIARCTRCRMHLSICICALLPTLATRTRLILLIHRKEIAKPTNSGQLAALCLSNSEVVCRGDRREGASVPLPVPATSQPLLVFPHEDATPLTDWAQCDQPIALVFPDGTWRQASKMRKRVLGLAGMPCVSLPHSDEATSYRLRAEQHPGGLATMEAIARAMGVLEGAAVESALLHVFRIMVERVLWTRGNLAAHKVTGGIPPNARRDQPLGPPKR